MNELSAQATEGRGGATSCTAEVVCFHGKGIDQSSIPVAEAAAGGAEARLKMLLYLYAAERQQIRIFCDDGLGQLALGEEGQLSISLVRSHNTVHPSGPCSLVHKRHDNAVDVPPFETLTCLCWSRQIRATPAADTS